VGYEGRSSAKARCSIGVVGSTANQLRQSRRGFWVCGVRWCKEQKGAPMFDYRIYFLNDEGHVDRLPWLVKCMSDEHATKQALQLKGPNAIELWQGARRVVKIARSQ
jgi:hypothetical protein